jgi:ribosomal protein L7Ae-like RNA K-turn-binding protein
MTTEIQAVDFETALKRIVQTSNADSLLAKGIHEVAKALESKDEKVKAKYIILAKNCTEANYVKIVKGLAAQNKVILLSFRSQSLRLKLERLSENGSESASTTRTVTSPKRENAHLSLSGTSLTMLRRKKRRSS